MGATGVWVRQDYPSNPLLYALLARFELFGVGMVTFPEEPSDFFFVDAPLAPDRHDFDEATLDHLEDGGILFADEDTELPQSQPIPARLKRDDGSSRVVSP
jgi:hypothetical protein